MKEFTSQHSVLMKKFTYAILSLEFPARKVASVCYKFVDRSFELVS